MRDRTAENIIPATGANWIARMRATRDYSTWFASVMWKKYGGTIDETSRRVSFIADHVADHDSVSREMSK